MTKKDIQSNCFLWQSENKRLWLYGAKYTGNILYAGDISELLIALLGLFSFLCISWKSKGLGDR